jgi:hypothetical protein
MLMKLTDAELIASRDSVFDRLCEIWTETEAASNELLSKPNCKATEWTGDNWRKANTLQAVAEYWNTSPAGPRRDKAMDLMVKGYKFYSSVKSSPTIWVDDFGWWAGFFTDLYAYDQKLPNPFDPDNLWIEIIYCYERMQKNRDLEFGGIWNDPDINGASREKNTITNSWMLNIAWCLFIHVNSHLEYKEVAESQYIWLTTGQYRANKPTDWRLHTPEKVLLWLPHNGPTDSEHLCWTGDEGVFLRGITYYVNSINPSSKNKLLQTYLELIDASLKVFVNPNGIVHESEYNALWGNDLATGKGVFMRLVTRFVHRYDFFGDAEFERKFLASAHPQTPSF